MTRSWKKVKQSPSLLVRPWAFPWSPGEDPRGGYGLIRVTTSQRQYTFGGSRRWGSWVEYWSRKFIGRARAQNWNRPPVSISETAALCSFSWWIVIVKGQTKKSTACMRFYAGCFLGDAEHCMLDCFNVMVLFRVEEKYMDELHTKI
jgi:hypothetical protein